MTPHLTSHPIILFHTYLEELTALKESSVLKAVVNEAVCWVPLSPNSKKSQSYVVHVVPPAALGLHGKRYPSQPTHLSKQWAADRVPVLINDGPPQIWKPAWRVHWPARALCLKGIHTSQYLPLPMTLATG